MVERALAAGPEPPERAAAAAEDDDLARIRIVGDEIAAAADLVRVGRVTDARRMTRPVDARRPAGRPHSGCRTWRAGDDGTRTSCRTAGERATGPARSAGCGSS